MGLAVNGLKGRAATACKPAAKPTADPQTWGITVTPNADANAQIFKNSEIPPHAAISGWAVHWLKYKKFWKICTWKYIE